MTPRTLPFDAKLRTSREAGWMAGRAARSIRWIALLGLCSAYLQGGLNKATDFGGAIAEMEHFGMPRPRDGELSS